MFDEEFTVVNLLNFHEKLLFIRAENQLEKCRMAAHSRCRAATCFEN
jgi:hypothetical protein